MKLHVIGDCFGQGSGYNRHCLQLVEELLRQGVDISVESPLHQNWQSKCSQGLLETIESGKDFRSENLLMVLPPPFWSQGLSEHPKRFIGFLVFEGDKLPEGWVEQCNEADLIFVPSKHTKVAATSAGVTVPIKVIPHGVSLKDFNPDVQPNPKVLSDKFTFLFVGGWSKGNRDRKNFQLLAKSFCQEFKEDEDVRLLAKLNMAYNGPEWDLNNEMDQLNLKNPHAELTVITTQVLDSELPGIYKAGDVFVCPTKAESFGLVFAEAMACGLPCIAGGYGGQTDFITEANGWLLKPQKYLQASDPEPIYEGVKWAEYKQEDLQKLLRYCYENQEEAKKKGFKAFNDIHKYQWKHTVKKIKKVL